MTPTPALVLTVTIAFEGLLMFQSDTGNQKHVAIVDARGDALHNHDTPLIAICRSDAGYQCTDYPLEKGDKVYFDNSPGAIDPDGLYKKHVPELRDFIVYGKVDPHVVNNMSGGDGVLALVDLPAGRLTTWGGFDETVQLSKGGLIRRRVNKCFARYVVLATTVSPMSLYIEHNGTSAPYGLRPEDLIFVSNTSADPYHLHFPLYTRLLTLDGQLGPVRRLATNDANCIRSIGKGQFSRAIEKVLEDRYIRVPHGDCGPTGP